MSALKVGPDVRNCVKKAKMNNLCTLEQIHTIVVNFCICGKSGVFSYYNRKCGGIWNLLKYVRSMILISIGCIY
jgi:hypothetical protein